jgi:hypothetical protein
MDMRGKQYPHRSGGTVSVTGSTLLVAVALLGGLFTMVVAASYPGAATAVTTSVTLVAALKEGRNRATPSQNSGTLTRVLERVRIARTVSRESLDS